MWRIIPLETHSGAMNMAIDEAISESVSRGSQPTIRFYQWKPSTVSIGYFQSLHEEVDLDICKKNGVDVVRRRTGGGAVFHASEITYSVIGPFSLFPKNIIESYKVICSWVIQGLANLGIEASFIPINDIVVNGKKVSGNAQTRRGGVLLQHGTILYDVDVDTMFSLLKVPNEKMRDKVIANVKERVTAVHALKNVTQNQTYEALLKGFTSGKEYQMGSLTPQELSRAKELVHIRYGTTEWNQIK